jgi:hypothetical protein
MTEEKILEILRYAHYYDYYVEITRNDDYKKCKEYGKKIDTPKFGTYEVSGFYGGNVRIKNKDTNIYSCIEISGIYNIKLGKLIEKGGKRRNKKTYKRRNKKTYKRKNKKTYKRRK